jgi:hypothetical protein
MNRFPDFAEKQPGRLTPKISGKFQFLGVFIHSKA